MTSSGGTIATTTRNNAGKSTVSASNTTKNGGVEYICVPNHCVSSECVEIGIRWLEMKGSNWSYLGSIDSTVSKKVEDLRVRAALYCLGLKIHEAEVSSSFAGGVMAGGSDNSKCVSAPEYDMGGRSLDEAFQWRYDWELEVISIPVMMKDLSRDASVVLEIVKCSGEVIYSSSMALFDTNGKLKTGLQKVPLAPSAELTRRPGPSPENAEDERWKATLVLEELEQQETLSWLDSLTLQAVRRVACAPCEGSNDTDYSYLVLDLPVFPVPIVHEELFYANPINGSSGAVTPLQVALFRQHPNLAHPLSLLQIMDYENEDDSPFQDKYRTLAHDLLRGLVDPALKPDKQQRERLNAIIASPSHHPNQTDKDLLWRFRFSLVDNRKALTKFLLAVDWTVETEVVQAAELLNQWRKRSPIELGDALKLLGKDVAFQTSLVRSYAIDTLSAATDDDLSLYLLQLVQALKYEHPNVASNNNTTTNTNSAAAVSPLAKFLIDRASQNLNLANYLYWYLKVELQNNPTFTDKYDAVFQALRHKLSSTFYNSPHINNNNNSLPSLVVKSHHNRQQHQHHQYSNLKNQITMWDILHAQDQYISTLLSCQMTSRDTRGKKDAKETVLRSLLAEQNLQKITHIPPVSSIPLPTNPDIFVTGACPTTARMFKSALYPAVIEFFLHQPQQPYIINTKDPTSPTPTYKVIIKTGDDLRQDQLVSMMVRLMDKLLKRGTLDLCLISYSIIATSQTSGLVGFVENSMPLSQILTQYQNSILLYFQSIAWSDTAKYNIQSDVLQSYIRSCAGYCVITYLLAVGDRHLDNIMLLPTGHFFHIDFGFMFGRDPKPLPPPFRLTREMVEGMGGISSPEYAQFCSYACQAYNLLRKSANLVLNLLNLMCDAGIVDLSQNPIGDADGVIAKVEERFRLELTDEQAECYFLGLINDTLSAFAPRVMDVFHQIAVSRR